MQEQVFNETELAIVRGAFARQTLAVAGVLGEADPRLEQAFADVPRERYLGPPPWQITQPPGGYITLPVADPVLAYQDVLFALSPERGVNNGSPSLHARWLHAMAPREGNCVAHIGAGAGYYTALLAKLVGLSGYVVALEFEPKLVEYGASQLAPLAQRYGCPRRWS